MFKRLSPSERFKLMVEKGLCFSCFAKHLRKDCKATVSCQVGGCKGYHHTLLREINSRESRFREVTPSSQIQDTSSVQTSTAVMVTPMQQQQGFQQRRPCLQKPNHKGRLPLTICRTLLALRLLSVKLFTKSFQCSSMALMVRDLRLRVC